MHIIGEKKGNGAETICQEIMEEHISFDEKHPLRILKLLLKTTQNKHQNKQTTVKTKQTACRYTVVKPQKAKNREKTLETANDKDSLQAEDFSPEVTMTRRPQNNIFQKPKENGNCEGYILHPGKISFTH